jgi:hypothetical protein
MTVSAGAYVVNVAIQFTNPSNATGQGTCTLTPSAAIVGAGDIVASKTLTTLETASVSANGLLSLATTTNLSLDCTGSGASPMSPVGVQRANLTAIKVGAAHAG